MLDINFENAKVLVAGDIMLDRYWSGATSRISPEAPVPVVKINEDEDRVGGAGNVAINIAALGGNASIFSFSGEDAAAAKLEQILSRYSIRCFFEKSPNLPTALKLRVLSKHQQLLRMDFEESFLSENKQNLYKNFSENLDTANAVILSDYGKGVLNNPQKLINMARGQSIPVLVDPKGADFTRYKNSTVITPNRAEFEAVAGSCASIEEITKKALKLIKKLKLEAMLITLSEDGMLLVNAGGEAAHLPTKAREVFDVTGAGDTVIATFATALGAGYDYIQAMDLANLAAGIVVGKLGTSIVSHHELLSASIAAKDGENHKIQTEEHLRNTVRHLQKTGEKVVMTNGCFDILHAGHVNYLQAAKSLGDKLIVAVNTDESVTKLKGMNRPIQTLSQRMEVLAALEAVDFIVPFASQTPEKLYCDILPDVLVKGGDYNAEDVAGAKCVKNNGGEVQILEFVEGQSTSSIISKIKELNT